MSSKYILNVWEHLAEALVMKTVHLVDVSSTRGTVAVDPLGQQWREAHAPQP